MKLSRPTPDASSLEQSSVLGSSGQVSLLGRAIRYLSIREHSQEELIRKLKPYAASPEEIEEVLQKLSSKGLQSNQRFAENLIRRKAEKYGELRLQQELKLHQIDPQIRQELLQKLHASEFERACALWEKKFGVKAKDPKEIAKQARFLANRGFSAELISKIIR